MDTRNRIAMLENRIDEIKNRILEITRDGLDEQNEPEWVDLNIDLAELEDELNFAWQDDEEECDAMRDWELMRYYEDNADEIDALSFV